MTKVLAVGSLFLLALLAISGGLLVRAYKANGALETRLASAQAVIAQREADARANAVAVAQLSQKLNDTEAKVITVTERIYSAPVTRECVRSPSIGTALGGVRDIYAPALQAPGGRQPAPAVR